MLNKISWAKKDTKMYDLTFVEAKKGKLIDKWSKKIVVVPCCGREMRLSQRVQTPSYKINEFWESNVQKSMVTIVNNTIFYT